MGSCSFPEEDWCPARDLQLGGARPSGSGSLEPILPHAPVVPGLPQRLGHSGGLGVRRPGLGSPFSTSAAGRVAHEELPFLSEPPGPHWEPNGSLRRKFLPLASGGAVSVPECLAVGRVGSFGWEGQEGQPGADVHCHHAETEGPGCSRPDLRVVDPSAYWLLGTPPPVAFGEARQVRHIDLQLFQGLTGYVWLHHPGCPHPDVTSASIELGCLESRS